MRRMLRLRRPRDAVAHPCSSATILRSSLWAAAFFLFQKLVAPGFEFAEAAVEAARRAAVEPDRGARKVLQETPVVADDDERAARLFQLVFQPFDGRQIEMVGRFVEQQDVGIGRERPGERRAARLAARKSLQDLRRPSCRAVPAGSGRDADRRSDPDRPRPRTGRRECPKNPVPARGSARWSPVAGSAGRHRLPARPARSSAASTCPSHCARRDRSGRRPDSELGAFEQQAPPSVSIDILEMEAAGPWRGVWPIAMAEASLLVRAVLEAGSWPSATTSRPAAIMKPPMTATDSALPRSGRRRSSWRAHCP